MKLKRSILSAAAVLLSAVWLCPSALAAGRSYAELTETESSGSTGALIASACIVVLMFVSLSVVVHLGRSGRINVPWAVLSVVFTALALLLCVIGSRCGALYSRPEGNPRDTVEKFYDSVVSGDYETAYSCLKNYDTLGLEKTPSSEAGAMAFDALKESYDYTLELEPKIDDISAVQSVRFRYLNMSALEDSVQDGTEKILKKMVEELPPDEVYDSENHFLPEVASAAYREALGSVLSHASSYYTTAVLNVNLEYSGGEWLIVCDQSMLNALAGGTAY
ncbi:MAG: hypothetical protein ACOX68_03880 [Candidatus Limivicinus sp.]